jgi:4-hydroxy-tetrahydrodipicolinate reductase
MTRVLVLGACGRMGQYVLRGVEAHPELSVGAALERRGHPELGREVSPGVKLEADLASALARCDVAIDFTLPDSTLALLDAATPHRVPCVVATTGFDAGGEERIARAAREIPIVKAASFSVGVNILMDLVADAARRLEGYEIDVLEMHHDQKVDAPSGTALTLAARAAEARGLVLDEVAVFQRVGHTGPRDPRSIGLQVLRLGDSVGEHTVYFAGRGERVELAVRSLSRETYASGAIRAAHWLMGRPPGLYSMRDVVR